MAAWQRLPVHAGGADQALHPGSSGGRLFLAAAPRLAQGRRADASHAFCSASCRWGCCNGPARDDFWTTSASWAAAAARHTTSCLHPLLSSRPCASSRGFLIVFPIAARRRRAPASACGPWSCGTGISSPPRCCVCLSSRLPARPIIISWSWRPPASWCSPPGHPAIYLPFIPDLSAPKGLGRGTAWCSWSWLWACCLTWAPVNGRKDGVITAHMIDETVPDRGLFAHGDAVGSRAVRPASGGDGPLRLPRPRRARAHRRCSS